jgi:phosphoenolpyruvate synthase/pyruvate phosphate dikinase
MNLRRLMKIGVRVPITYVCDWEAFHRYLAGYTSLIPELREELTSIIAPDKKYAVRSSGNIEDSLERSFAGQFQSSLNIQGMENILQAIISIWSSANTPIVHAYLERHDISSSVSMAVIIQEMVNPVYSGVTLSKNPVTGADEVVVEAVRGEGTLLVQTGVTPDRWINKWGYWREKADSSDIPLTLIEQIVEETKNIANRLGHPVDMEWVFNGRELYWVQMRQITAMPNRNVYSNHIPREMLAGMIKPLIFSVNIPLINSVWIRFLGEITGDLGIRPEDLAKSFYYRVYFNMGVLGSIFKGLGLPAESVEMLMGILPRGAARPHFKPSLKTISRLPWALAFFYDKWFFGNKMKRALAGFEPQVKAIPYRGLDEWTTTQLLDAIERHYRLMQEVAYFNVVGPLLMMMYNLVLGHQLSRMQVEIKNFDLTENLPDLSAYDPSEQLHELNMEFRAFPPKTQDRIRSTSFPELCIDAETGNFGLKIEKFLEKFGHLSNNGNDFSVTPWRETPELVLKMVCDFEPQKDEKGGKVRMEELSSREKINPWFKLLYHRSREFRLLREQVSSLYTYGYGLFRYYYLALGKHFVHAGYLDSPEEIFYLTRQQVQDIVSGKQVQMDFRTQAAQHKTDIKRFETIQLPTIIYGDELPPIREASMDALVGIPTSIGCYKGRVRVVKGIQDFSKVKNGDVLVIPYSEVSWSPLFARAGAVVAESGGLLSHSSIIAREYNIPAVVSVEGATRLEDDVIVTVDGHKGEVIIHKTL